ncbi:MAG: DapH/DapD/GlmU-related protein [Bacteroidales bacterium]
MVAEFIHGFDILFEEFRNALPWAITSNLQEFLDKLNFGLDEDFIVKDGLAIHKTAVIENGAVLKPPVVIGRNCFIGAHAYLRGGVYLSDSVRIGPSCEIKSSLLMSETSVAHFNFIGDSIVGHKVNFEAGSITANHYNERSVKRIFVKYKDKIIDTSVEKFGALVGDGCRIGANAVLSPGTLLLPGSLVKRLELVEQV